MVGHQAPIRHAGLSVQQVLVREAELRRSIPAGREGIVPVAPPLRDMPGQNGPDAAIAAWHLLKECNDWGGSLRKAEKPTQFRLSLFSLFSLFSNR
jgi:hypothetical protein